MAALRFSRYSPALPYPPQGKVCKTQRAQQLYFFFSLQYKYLGNYFQDCDIYVGEDNIDIFIRAVKQET